MKILKIIRQLTSNPGSEKDPEEWLTRFVAHCAVGLGLFTLAFPMISPELAVAAALLVYAWIEFEEVRHIRRTPALIWDCVLDWTAVAIGASIGYCLWYQDWISAMLLLGTGVLTAEAGVRKRWGYSSSS